jgi:hypothetical protein
MGILILVQQMESVNATEGNETSSLIQITGEVGTSSKRIRGATPSEE